MKRYFAAFLAALGILSCTKQQEAFEITVRTTITLQQETKVCLTGADSPLKGGRIWTWEKGDALTYTYLLDGEEHTLTSSQVEIDKKNPSLLHVTLKGVPQDAVFTKVVYGSEAAFSKTCTGTGLIPSSMVFATGLINSDPGETNIPGVTLDHQCSYFLIYPDYVHIGTASYQIKDFEVSGKCLTGKDGEEKLSLTLYDAPSRTFAPVWLALSCKASDIVFTADYGAGKAEMARVASAGGKCTLFEISNQAIGESYN